MFAKNSRCKYFGNILVFAILFMGAIVVFLVALGSASQISITAPSFNLDWNLDPRTNPNTQQGDLIVNSDQPWSVTVSAQTRDNDGCMAEAGQGNGISYATNGKKLQSAMKISANVNGLNVYGLIGHDVDLSQGGVLLQGNGGEGELHIPVVVDQAVNWQDEPLHNGNFYHMIVSFIASPELGCEIPWIDSLSVSPQGGQVPPGETATIEVHASGSGPLTYQWFKGKAGESSFGILGKTLLKDGGHISGASTPKLTISNFDCSDNGTYNAVVSNSCGFDLRNQGLIEKYSLYIQPDYQWVLDGETTTFSAIVDPAGDSYQWQTSSDLYGSQWSDITNNPTATSSTLSFTATPADNWRWFRVIVNKGVCSWISDWWGQLNVGFNGPDDQAVLGWGDNVQFSVEPSDMQIFGYQWQVSDGGAAFIDINGATDPTYSFTTSNADSSRKYRVLVTDKATGFRKPSREAVINIGIVGPQDQTVGVCEGGVSFAYFPVKPASNDYDYTWYRSVSGGWEAYGSNTWNYEYQADISDNNRKFYVHIKNRATGSEGDSNTATLTVYNKPCISSQTYQQTVCQGGTATFNVVASGDSLSYQWYKVNSQGPEIKLVDDNRISGSITDTLTISNVEDSDTAAYYVLINGLHDSTAASEDAPLTVGLPSITGPSDEMVIEGGSAEFWVQPEDETKYSYQWWEYDGNVWAKINGATHCHYVINTVLSSYNGRKYHVVVTGSSPDCSETSIDATLTVSTEPDFKISLESDPKTVQPGEDFTYTIGYLNKGYPAYNTGIEFNHDPNVQFLSAYPNPDSSNGNTLTWSLGTLDYQGSGTILIAVRVPYSLSSGTLSSVARLFRGEGSNMVEASSTTEVKGDATLLNIYKEASAQAIYPDSDLDYLINYQNRGQSTFHNVTINDTVDKHMQFEAATPPPTRILTDNDGTHLWWSAADLGSQSMAAGSSRVIFLRAYLPDVPPDFDSVFNRYDVSSNEMKGNFNTLETFVVHSLWINKTADKQAYSQGEVVNYTITYGNEGAWDFKGVSIEDNLPDLNYTEYVSASPQPSAIDGNVLLWNNIGTLRPGDRGTIQLYMRIKENCTEMSYKSSGFISGEGFANIRQNLDTAQKPDHLTNIVTITGYKGLKKEENKESRSASATIKLADALGTAVNIRSHGSGTYTREDQTQMLMKNRSIQVKTSLSETYHPTTVALPNGRSIKYSSKFSEAQTGKNRITGATLSEVYMYANRIKRDSTINLDKNGSTLASETSFEGAGHIDVVKKECENPKVAPTYESHEDYLGSFKVNTNVDEYGKNVVSNRSVIGTGMAASDKRIKKSQRSYESGTGAYQVDDRMETQTNYMAKDLNVSYAPVSYTYTPDFKVNLSKKWEEGMWSKSGVLNPKGSNSNQPASLIGEEFSGADYLKMNTIANGLNEMDTNAEFSGKAQFKVVKDSNSNKSNEVNLYDLYIGKYKITRKTTITGVAKYDVPHLTITKEGLAEPAGGRFVSYKITVTNDGNQALEPVYVLDLFPPGTAFVSSSLRPTELASNYSRWTLTNLGIGSSSRIDLKLKMTEETGSIVNEVQTKGGYNNTWVSAENYSALRKGWLSCSLTQLLAAKEAYVDPKDPMLVHFRIFLKNRLNDTMAASVTDQLPGEMEFVNSSTAPASHEPDKVIWNIIDVKPGENVTIDYLARALQRGTFVNQAHIDASYLNGGASVETDITSSVNIGGGGSYSSSFSGWQPPACFGLNCTGQGSADEWIPCVSCGGSEPQPIVGSQPLDSSCPSCVPSVGVDDNEVP